MNWSKVRLICSIKSAETFCALGKHDAIKVFAISKTIIQQFTVLSLLGL